VRELSSDPPIRTGLEQPTHLFTFVAWIVAQIAKNPSSKLLEIRIHLDAPPIGLTGKLVRDVMQSKMQTEKINKNILSCTCLLNQFSAPKFRWI
jgi:hypothetical protein